MVMALRSCGLPGDKLPPVCHNWLGPLWTLHQTLQMGAPLYRSPAGDITLPRHTELMMKANISVLTHIYQINFIFYRPSTGLLAYWRFADRRRGRRRGSNGWGAVNGWAWEKGVGGQWGLMVFTIFNAEGCHHWISILNNVAFHHKFFTTYLLNGKSYGSLSGW